MKPNIGWPISALLRRATADATFLSTYPRLVLEPAGMALIAAFAGYVLVSQQG